MYFFNKRKTHLPFGKGKYIPGAIDVMTEYDKHGIFIRLYYPTELSGNITDYCNKWIPWFSEMHYLRGMAKVINIWFIILRAFFWLYAGNLHIPVVYGGPPKKDDKMKCIVLSHGLGALRFFYSTMCTDLASRGFLVAVIEHRDESACSTYYYSSEEDAKCNRKTYINYGKVNLGESHYPVRNRQVHYRSEELIRLVNLLYSLNKGSAPKNVLENVPKLQSQLNGMLKSFENCLDLTDITAMGHSFGGATALLTLYKDNRLRQGILLDPWMFPIKDESQIFENIVQPLLFINTQTFHNDSNVKSMEKLLLQNIPTERRMYTILHTTHESQTDSPFVCGYWLNWFMKKLPPICAHKINNYLILTFLHKQIGYPLDIQDGEEYLSSQSHNFVEGLTKAWC